MYEWVKFQFLDSSGINILRSSPDSLSLLSREVRTVSLIPTVLLKPSRIGKGRAVLGERFLKRNWKEQCGNADKYSMTLITGCPLKRVDWHWCCTTRALVSLILDKFWILKNWSFLMFHYLRYEWGLVPLIYMIPNINIEWEKVSYHLRFVLLILLIDIKVT